MSQFWKFSSILAVLALLVVMGLSTQGSVQAQTAPAGETIGSGGPPIYICTDRDCDLFGANNATGDDNVFGVNFTGTGTTTIHNLDLPRTPHRVETDRTSARITTLTTTSTVLMPTPSN